MHNLNIVHRDLKCTNIVVKEDENVAIIDLGEGGAMEGYYWSGDEDDNVEDSQAKAWCDIFALGVVLWKLSDPSRKPIHGKAPVASPSSEIPSDYCSIIGACVVADCHQR